mmetsp:Transcript_4086/g.8649  ORF Transcript_4086/g.8649 Transcript_4086/m.8649 type:complete len:219 (-) Transcript_4086:1015-1671(-)
MRRDDQVPVIAMHREVPRVDVQDGHGIHKPRRVVQRPEGSEAVDPHDQAQVLDDAGVEVVGVVAFQTAVTAARRRHSRSSIFPTRPDVVVRGTRAKVHCVPPPGRILSTKAAQGRRPGIVVHGDMDVRRPVAEGSTHVPHGYYRQRLVQHVLHPSDWFPPLSRLAMLPGGYGGGHHRCGDGMRDQYQMRFVVLVERIFPHRLHRDVDHFDDSGLMPFP